MTALYSTRCWASEADLARDPDDKLHDFLEAEEERLIADLLACEEFVSQMLSDHLESAPKLMDAYKANGSVVPVMLTLAEDYLSELKSRYAPTVSEWDVLKDIRGTWL